MKLHKPAIQLSCLLVFVFFLSSCVPQSTEPETKVPEAPTPPPVEKPEKKAQLPVQYQQPSYLVDVGNIDSLDEAVEDTAIKVGASIRSTQGPQPLWDILKRLAALKRMSVSWASDVDQYVLVDVDISASDDFFNAIDNLLRQVDYYHEIEGSTIVVKYKETRQFHIAMPYTKQLFETGTGGNVLGSNESSSNIEGTIRLDSKGNEFDIWENIKLNLDTIMDKWSYRREAEDTKKDTTEAKDEGKAASRGFKSGRSGANTTLENTEANTDNTMEAGHLQKTAGLGYYIVDKHLGLISVTAPRPILEKVDLYLKSISKEIYKQVAIEAKIIEVQLTDHSSIGLNWNMILKNLTLSGGGSTSRSRNHGTTNTTTSNNTWGRNYSNAITSNGTSDTDTLGITTTTGAGTSASSATVTSGATSAIGAATVITNSITDTLGAAVSLAAFSFDSFLNVLKEQGQTTILSNPKISVLNGQPSLITVGRNVTYVDSIESDVNNDTGTVSYTVNTERVLSGVGLALTATILDDEEIVMNLVPVTSELQEPIEYRQVGLGEVGLPVINIREMSTTVRVKDGDMLVIGGLIGSSDAKDGSFIPGLGSIPGLRYLFGYEEKTNAKKELIILLKPRII